MSGQDSSRSRVRLWHAASRYLPLAHTPRRARPAYKRRTYPPLTRIEPQLLTLALQSRRRLISLLHRRSAALPPLPEICASPELPVMVSNLATPFSLSVLRGDACWSKFRWPSRFSPSCRLPRPLSLVPSTLPSLLHCALAPRPTPTRNEPRMAVLTNAGELRRRSAALPPLPEICASPELGVVVSNLAAPFSLYVLRGDACRSKFLCRAASRHRTAFPGL